MSSVPVAKPPYDPKRRYTVAEYLALDASDDDERYEYLDGYVTARRAGAAAEVFDMAGASFNHHHVIRNLVLSLTSRLPKHCQALSSDLRVRIPREQLYSYPDVFVVCGNVVIEEIQGVETVVNPVLIFEVLSRSTEQRDRGPKFTRYREIASFREYVLVSQFEKLVEPFFKRADESWTIGTPIAGPNGSLRLNSLNIEIPLAEIYAGVVFADPATSSSVDTTGEPDKHASS